MDSAYFAVASLIFSLLRSTVHSAQNRTTPLDMIALRAATNLPANAISLPFLVGIMLRVLSQRIEGAASELGIQIYVRPAADFPEFWTVFAVDHVFQFYERFQKSVGSVITFRLLGFVDQLKLLQFLIQYRLKL